MTDISKEALVATLTKMSMDEVQAVLDQVWNGQSAKEEAVAALRQHAAGTHITQRTTHATEG